MTATDLDAFTDTDAVARMEAAAGGTSGQEPPPGFEPISMLAALQDTKVSRASNGSNYDIKFETDLSGFTALALEGGKGGVAYAVTWNKLLVGDGGEVRRLTASRDADGNMHYWVNIHLPESEISRSLGRLGAKLGVKASLELEPLQGSLGLADGTQVDLTKKAE